ncbi:4-amino-4-deoxy-L-arabinose-phosphoundecaprenol flippase subunit ArnF [Serratia microhaemolytica]|uniref:4-amino-4-deoxy-L-arabinose-phosphoundecaprenol flippase subunit ArnF n=1 Tax=Serratia microhaemolytica TaxID=2675110 RepID=UPI000FDDCB8A|nr:4-amino-4-deoxy-L-arabinose-phosphoundecaprenol flippase subunit ArnF [Serratia microhaemolytica]
MGGYLLAGASVLLVTLAQLLMKWGMQALPPLPRLPANWSLFSAYPLPLTGVMLGMLAYAVSMLCWFFALRRLPLHRAYPLLSLSYVLVYLAAVTLPVFAEPLTILKTLGTLLILAGVWLIHRARPETEK